MKNVFEVLDQMLQDSQEEISNIIDLDKLKEVEKSFLGRNGKLQLVMKSLSDAPVEERKGIGQKANETKWRIEALIREKAEELKKVTGKVLADTEWIDVTEPAVNAPATGHLHPVTQVQEELEALFTSMGFMVLDGPELESDFYNFTALNIPPSHPARDMQDTFYVEGLDGVVMRTHTSPVQVRSMRTLGAPLRIVVPGRCFRNEATDVRHEHTFHQLEGLVVDKGISMAHLKGVLEVVAKHLYGQDTKIRLRPKFYPFVEPGVNGEVTCYLCKGDGCRLCKKTGWLEIFGAGMVHPNVLREGNIDSTEYSGFAFGFGLTRLVMLKYGIDDIRHLESGDLRFLRQF